MSARGETQVALFINARRIVDVDASELQMCEEGEDAIFLLARHDSADLREAMQASEAGGRSVDVSIFVRIAKSLAWLSPLFGRRGRVESRTDAAIAYHFTGKGGSHEAVKNPPHIAEEADTWSVWGAGRGPRGERLHERLSRERAIEVAYNLAQGWTEEGDIKAEGAVAR